MYAARGALPPLAPYFYPLSSALPTLPPKEEARLVFTVFARKRSDEANSREGGFPQSIYFSLWSWDISLALNMTRTLLQGIAAVALLPRNDK